MVLTVSAQFYLFSKPTDWIREAVNPPTNCLQICVAHTRTSARIFDEFCQNFRLSSAGFTILNRYTETNVIKPSAAEAAPHIDVIWRLLPAIVAGDCDTSNAQNNPFYSD